MGQAGALPRAPDRPGDRRCEGQAAQHGHRDRDDRRVARGLLVVREHPHTASIVLDGPHRAVQPDRRPQAGGQFAGHLLIAAGHPPGWPAPEPRGDVADRRGGQHAGPHAVGCLDPGQVRGQGRGSLPAGHHLRQRRARRRPGRGGGHGGRAAGHVLAGRSLLAGGLSCAAVLPVVVRHGRVGQIQPQLVQHRPHHVVTVEHELRAPLDDRPRVTGEEFLGPHAAPDPVAGLQHDHLVAGLEDPVGRHQAGEPGTCHHDTHP